MNRTKSKNAKTVKRTNKGGTSTGAGTSDMNELKIEIAQLQEEVRLLQLENDTLRKHINMPNRLNSDHDTSTQVKAQEIYKPNVLASICRCKGNCSTRRCRCMKENNKCTPLCKCNGEICQNQDPRDQNQESDQEDKENNFMNDMATPRKEEKEAQDEVVMRTRGDNLANAKVTSNIEEQFNPMKPRHQLSRTPPTNQNRKPANETHDNIRQSPLLESPRIIASSFNIENESLNVEKEVDWEQHTAQLIPCKKCKRTFMPHRIQKHEACCKRI